MIYYQDWMSLRNLQSAELPVAVRHGPAFELLAGLYASGTPDEAARSKIGRASCRERV